MRSRLSSPLALAVVPAAFVLGACGRRPAPAPPAPAQSVRVDLVALAHEHPLFPQLGRLEQLAGRVEAGEMGVGEPAGVGSATPPPSVAEKGEAKSPPPESKALKQGGAAPGRDGEGPELVPAHMRAELAAIREQAAAAAREWGQPAAPTSHQPSAGSPRVAPPSDSVARARAAADLRAEARRLAAIIREETAVACRRIAADRDLRLNLAEDQTPEGDRLAPDRTEAFRQWLRAHWQP